MITEEQNTAKRIRAYQVEQLYTRFPTVAWLTLGILAVLVIIQWRVIKPWILLVWWGVLVVIYAARLYLVSLYRRAKPSPANIEPWATRFLIGTVCASLGWGAAGVFLFSPQDVASQLVLILIIAGMSSTGLAALTSVREDIIAFLCCMLIPPIVRIAFMGTKIYLIMSGLILVYLVALLLTSRHMTNAINELLTLRIKSMQQTEKLQESEELLKQSESRLSGILSSMVDLLFAFDKEGRFTFYHSGAEAALFFPPEQFMGKKHVEVMPPHINELFAKAFKKVSKGQVVDYEYWFDLDEGIRWFSVKLSPMFLDGEFIGAVAVVRDITERKQAEEKIKASLAEKEVLLKEIHHRVKNNLQIISSLLNLQSGYIKDKKTIEVFKNSQERVLAMALIHEKMYQSKDLSKINFREYINSLITSLYDSYYLEPGQVELKTQIEDVALDIETAIPLGLILNELISNSLKHAFPDHHRGELRINLKESDDKEYDYTLIVGDNGVGFPGGMDFQNSGGLGMVLVQSLVKKLKGVIDINRKDGTTFTITFKKLE